MALKIVTDSTSDVTEELAAEYGITVLPAYVNIGDESYLDQVELTRERFYAELPSFSAPPTTAAPPVGTFTETYNQLAAEGATEILSIHLASNLSGMLNAARLGAQAAEVPVHLFDSQQLSMGLGLLVLAAARRAEAGVPAETILAFLEERVNRTYVLAMLDTLEFLRRSGRVSWAQFGLGTLLRIKPILRVYKGDVEVVDRVRTSGRARQNVIEHVAALGPLEDIVLLHTHAPEAVEELREEASHLFPENVQPLALQVTPAIGAHTGPGALGIACITS
ncbi:MAG: DegV family protein [Candidatus Promineifilaceae bacterium]|nr:DegV family protein [Candidatus Promineifilaceae bacterium]